MINILNPWRSQASEHELLWFEMKPPKRCQKNSNTWQVLSHVLTEWQTSKSTTPCHFSSENKVRRQPLHNIKKEKHLRMSWLLVKMLRHQDHEFKSRLNYRMISHPKWKQKKRKNSRQQMHQKNLKSCLSITSSLAYLLIFYLIFHIYKLGPI